MHAKRLVIAVGALGLFPCLLGYLFELRIPGAVGGFFAWIGERTYSIYLWQQTATICDYLPASLHPLGALASIAVGAFWFNLFEKPFLSSRRVSEVEVPPAPQRPVDHPAPPVMVLTAE
jgi:peptidoglycan/LPS O-acetylase OafA/YrhL